MRALEPPRSGSDWLGVSSEPLPVAAAASWVVRPDCGAEVVFTGSVRDHAPGRPGVTGLEYEAYDEQVTPRLTHLVRAARARWPDLGRVVILHRVGPVGVGEVAVVVAASAPHRADAFDAARFGIDEVKATVPIWKREDWSGGSAWSLDGTDVREVAR